MKRVVFVTDPMCSWCWGMADDFRDALTELAAEAEFDLMLGGINTHGSQPIGDYGRRYLMKLWREVADTTGQKFGFQLPDSYVHNSVLPCLLLEAARDATGAPPFELLHALQARFFVAGEDITSMDLLAAMAEEQGIEDFAAQTRDAGMLERLRFQFEHAGSFGTNALPSLLIEDVRGLRLLAGGYVDGEMLVSLVRAQK